jgi:hypothetical protein
MFKGFGKPKQNATAAYQQFLSNTFSTLGTLVEDKLFLKHVGEAGSNFLMLVKNDRYDLQVHDLRRDLLFPGSPNLVPLTFVRHYKGDTDYTRLDEYFIVGAYDLNTKRSYFQFVEFKGVDGTKDDPGYEYQVAVYADSDEELDVPEKAKDALLRLHLYTCYAMMSQLVVPDRKKDFVLEFAKATNCTEEMARDFENLLATA